MANLDPKLRAVVENLQRMWELKSTYHRIEKVPAPSHEEFIDKYVADCRPVVFTGIMDDWPAMNLWSPERLAVRFGGTPVEVQWGREQDPRWEENKMRLKRTMPFDEFIHTVMSGPSNNCYLTANNELMRRPGFADLVQDIGSVPTFVDPSRWDGASFLWIGPEGTNTPLHHDTVMLLHAQIRGSKRWRFISPLNLFNVYNHMGVFSPIDIDNVDYNQHPLFKDVQILDVTVNEGETMFLPLGWWHQVTATSLSVSLSYTNLRTPNQYLYPNP